MDDNTARDDGRRGAVRQPAKPHKRRRVGLAIFGYLTVIILGVTVAILSSYGLRRLGF
jgi:hypothetical protein